MHYAYEDIESQISLPSLCIDELSNNAELDSYEGDDETNSAYGCECENCMENVF